MLEETVNLEINQTYTNLKTAFSAKGCKVTSEEPPKQIVFKQGSLWGMSPKTAKKAIKINLEPVDSGTKVVCSSSLSSDWKNITVIGSVLAAVLVGLCLWITVDLTSFMASLKPSFWSWIITANGTTDLSIGQAFTNLTKVLSAFLSLIIAVELADVVYVQRKIDVFAKELLNSIFKQQSA